MKEIAIYGFGGFGREVACLINMINEVTPQWKIIGFFDDGYAIGTKNRYGEVLGGLNELNNWDRELSVVITIATPHILEKLSSSITNSKVSFPNIMAPNTIIFDNEAFKIGKGNIFFLGCRISCDVEIGDFNIANGAVSLGHDVHIGCFNVLGPSTRISGGSIIGNTNFFGVYATILQNIKIGNNTRIGASSIVIRNTKDNFTYVGNPAKKIDF